MNGKRAWESSVISKAEILFYESKAYVSVLEAMQVFYLFRYIFATYSK